MFTSERASDQSHAHESMELGVDATNPFTTTNPQLIKTRGGGGDVRKLLPTDSSISIPPFPYDSALFESAPPSATPSEVQVHIPETTLPTSDDELDDPNSNHPVLKIIEKQELGKALLVLTPTMMMGLLTIHHSFAHTIEMVLLAVSLGLAFVLIWNGLISKMTNLKASSLLILAGIVWMILAFFLCLFCILPNYLKFIPVASFFLSIFQLVPAFVAVISSMKKKGNKVTSKESDLQKAEVKALFSLSKLASKGLSFLFNYISQSPVVCL